MHVVLSIAKSVAALEANDKARTKSFRPEISSQDPRKFLDNNHQQAAMLEIVGTSDQKPLGMAVCNSPFYIKSYEIDEYGLEAMKSTPKGRSEMFQVGTSRQDIEGPIKICTKYCSRVS
ncbi:UNVERIFIED_CONTAM: hypothetical protein Sindi_0050800 [Sesamum indicum]